MLSGIVPAHAEWNYSGPEGGTVRCISHDPATNTFYLGTEGGDLYTSSDLGNSWQYLNPGLTYTGFVIQSLHITHSSPTTMYAGTWGLWGGGGVYRSEDYGSTWKKCGLPDTSGVKALLIEPGNPAVFLAASSRRLFKSKDQCLSWEEISVPSNIQNIHSLAYLSGEPETIFLGTSRLSYRSNDRGITWEKIDKGMKEDSHIFQFLFTPTDPLALYAATCGWVYKSTTLGSLWTRYKSGLNNRRTHTIAMYPGDPGVLLAGTCGGLFKSLNGGKTWNLITNKNLVVNSIAFSTDQQPAFVLGCENDGIIRSTDNGKSFLKSNTGFHHLHVPVILPVPSESGLLYAGVVNAGSTGGLYASVDSGATWEQADCKFLFNNVYSIALKNNPYTRIYVGTEKGVYWRDRNSFNWTSSKSSRNLGRIQTITVPAASPDTILAGGNKGLFFSGDSGNTFTQVLTETGDKNFLNMHASDQTVYAGSNLGLCISGDSGINWGKLITPFSDERIQCILRDPLSPSQVYIGTFKGLYYGSPETNTWVKLELGSTIPDIADIRSDPFDPQTIIACSYLVGGVYVTSDKGKSWNRIDSFYNPVRAYTLAFDPFTPGKLYAGTFGNSVVVNPDYRKDSKEQHSKE